MTSSLAAQVRHARLTVGDLLARSLLVGILLVLAACGGASTAATESPASDGAGAGEATPEPAGDGAVPAVCDLLTLDEVSAATGVETVDTLGTDLTGQSACLYNDADGIPTASLAVMSSDGAVAPSVGYDAASEGSEPVSGIGDQARWHQLGTLYVMSGGNLFIVSVMAPDADLQQKKNASIDLARIAIDRYE
jgi:hypothetical protein